MLAKISLNFSEACDGDALRNLRETNAAIDNQGQIFRNDKRPPFPKAACFNGM
jgi:hypothetical protein